MTDETEDDYIARKVDAYEMSRRVLRSAEGKELWLVTTGGVGHALVASEPHVIAACGRSRWTHSRVIDCRPRILCPACAAAVGIVVEAPAAKRERQLGLF
jgi:hypothetical protein